MLYIENNKATTLHLCSSIEMRCLKNDAVHGLPVLSNCLFINSLINILAEGPDLVIHQSDTVLEEMNEWCVKQHGQSGLTAAVKASRVTEAAAETQTLQFLSQYVEEGKSPLCGNSIGQDRRFLEKFMPKLSRFVHYRNIDVSTVKELARRWRPEVLVDKDKSSAHRSLADIRESIAELQHYRDSFFRFEAK